MRDLVSPAWTANCGYGNIAMRFSNADPFRKYVAFKSRVSARRANFPFELFMAVFEFG